MNTTNYNEYVGEDRSFAYSQPSAPVRHSILDREIVAAPDIKASTPRDYKGRFRTWPGILLLLFIVGGAIAAIAVFAVRDGDAANQRAFAVQKKLAKERGISDGSGSGSSSVASDGQVNNPEVYPASTCQLPNYQSKNGKIYAVAANGTEVALQIKGVNWFGMETGLMAPFGLWDNDQNGTTVFAIAQFLANNKFNSVRIPLCVSSILQNKVPDISVINKATNRALDLTNYISLLQSIIEALAYRQISVMISMHTLDTLNTDGSLWYGINITVNNFLTAIDTLTTSLCSSNYWNVLGIDVKNEPYKGTWGTGLANDFLLGAELIGNRILKGCPSWLVFVEGVNSNHNITMDNINYDFYDWYGGGLQKAGAEPVVLSTSNKLVYAPHYYTPAVFPQFYLYGGGKQTSSNTIVNYIELNDSTLQGRVTDTMNEMFGYLITDHSSTVLLGEFGGLYTSDAHPLKTTQRCTNFTIHTIINRGYAGGYMWSLNPESAYQYNPADTEGNFVEGLLNPDWRSVNTPFLLAMNGLNALPNLQMMPCFRFSPLYVAAAHGHKDVVLSLILVGAMVDQKGIHGGNTPVHVAAKNNHKDALSVLISNKADSGYTPLYFAAEIGHDDVVQFHISAGARNQWAPLHIAAKNNYLDVVKSLILARVYVNKADILTGITPLYFAAQSGHKDDVLAQLSAGANENLDENIVFNIFNDTNDVDGFTPRTIAIQNGHKHIDKLFDSWVATKNKEHQKISLDTAAKNGQIYEVIRLISAGESVDQPDKDGRTPLHIAAQNGQERVIQFLISACADSNLSSKLIEYTPLYIFAKNGYENAIQLSISAGADLYQAIELTGYTLLHTAVENSHENVVQQFISASANFNQADNIENTALHVAAKNGQVLGLQQLISTKANLNSTTILVGCTPLHFAADKDYEKIVELHISTGADLHQPDSFGYTPIHIAAQKGHKNIVELLTSAGADINQGNDITRWPGVLLLLLLASGAIVAIVFFAINDRNDARQRVSDYQEKVAKEKAISDGKLKGPELVDSDGQVNNPQVYPSNTCKLPDYQSKNGKIYAVGANGTEVALQIKGVNWFGMETGAKTPFGLWDNDQNGTTVFAIAQFLAENKFNSVRIPLCVSSILQNKAPDTSIINRASNRALDLTSYISLLQSITKALSYRQISVMISMHTLDTDNKFGPLWYGGDITVKDFLSAIDKLTTSLCSNTYWNVLGIDVKNEPHQATWGTGSENDFLKASELIGARILKGCPKWLVFVEGIDASHTTTLVDKEFQYYDWYGGGLQDAGAKPVVLSKANKLVYTPHYYTPAVYPQNYLYGGGTQTTSNALANYVELSDSVLQDRVIGTMKDMFGYLISKFNSTVLLGEFGGLYSKDAHPLKTTQRCTNFTINTIVNNGYAGGYVWSLNPESAYQYNPADTKGNFYEGLLNPDWRSANMPFLVAMSGLDGLPNLQMMPCFTTPDDKPTSPKDYKGRLRRWPGVLLLVFVICGAIAAIVAFAVHDGGSSRQRASDYQKKLARDRAISDGTSSGSDAIDTDGQVNNPKVYPVSSCQQPNYLSKNGKIYAVAANGTEVALQIKGVNWFGMETGLMTPFGLWDNDKNGTTVFAIAQFLANNKFNSVRIPLCVASILQNKVPETSVINKASNRALDLTSYIALLQSIVQALAYRQISVMISMHTLDIYNKEGSLWYSKNTTVDNFLTAIDTLTTALCSNTYWNVLGIDVKNEPYQGSWGTGKEDDFQLGAELIGSRMLKGCSKWLVFVEGINSNHNITMDNINFDYYDWYGGGLHKAGDHPVVLPIANKVVYAPHYYTPAVFPQYYLYGGGKLTSTNTIVDFIELGDKTLQGRVTDTMNQMFGYLIKDHDRTVLLGEFGGLYTKDAHPLKTTQRCTNFTISTIVQHGYAGGYMWSLNPESAYQYNPSDNPGNFVEGLLNDDWRSANIPFLEAMGGLNALPNLQMMPCFST
ncbi:cell 5A endo-1,4-betaglucanase [Thraustotheca clavata]|uniref:Cell 5A endo-1,4-betaglucanase n=1 Tax=Thraustotheca clavata TaxID=74557 RepID=A0A1V9Z5N9_9STRA|nr:cell 5A endo-1,4-betaglucanase [Thraustotheca clavata]